MNNKKCLGLEEVAFILTIFRFQLQYTLTAWVQTILYYQQLKITRLTTDIRITNVVTMATKEIIKLNSDFAFI